MKSIKSYFANIYQHTIWVKLNPTNSMITWQANKTGQVRKNDYSRSEFFDRENERTVGPSLGSRSYSGVQVMLHL